MGPQAMGSSQLGLLACSNHCAATRQTSLEKAWGQALGAKMGTPGIRALQGAKMPPPGLYLLHAKISFPRLYYTLKWPPLGPATCQKA